MRRTIADIVRDEGATAVAERIGGHYEHLRAVAKGRRPVSFPMILRFLEAYGDGYDYDADVRLRLGMLNHGDEGDE